MAEPRRGLPGLETGPGGLRGPWRTMHRTSTLAYDRGTVALLALCYTGRFPVSATSP